MKETNPSKWYSLAKRLGTDDDDKGSSLKVECLEGLSDEQSAEKIAHHFSAISQEFNPLDMSKLPSYLPAPENLVITETNVAEKILGLKKRKSTLPCDLPSVVRKEFAIYLAVPMTNIINSCLKDHCYPRLWKHEYVVPVEKVRNPSTLKDLRKISLTSEFSLVFEKILKGWILNDLEPMLDKSQYGNRKGTGTEHMLVNLMDRLLKLLDQNSNKSAVLATLVDWASAFDRQDPTLAIEKFIKLGVRSSIIPILASYLSDRKMQVRFNNSFSRVHRLPGGGAQGTLLGVIQYLVQSNDNADCIDPSLRFKYVDDLSILELILFGGLLSEYDFTEHVASDIGIDENYIETSAFCTQSNLDKIADWTEKNCMKLNEDKTKYMVFSRSETEIATRLALNGKTLERIEEVKLLGVWFTTWLDWERNTAEICKRAYARLTLITKLKYVGVSTEDLVHLYILYIRSVLEYCSVLWHSTLTTAQSYNLERVQKTCIKVILGEEYVDYPSALEICGLETLQERRESRCLQFGLKCLLHPDHSNMFPVNPKVYKNIYNTRKTEHFIVNKAKSESYRMSAIPFIQRKLNQYVQNQSKSKP